MKFTFRAPIFTGGKWYDRNGKEMLSEKRGWQETSYTAKDMKKAARLNNILIAALTAAAVVVTLGGYLAA